MSIELTLEALQNSLDQFGESDKPFSASSNTVFLPDGKHKGRFIIDATGQAFFKNYKSYGYFKQGIRDPDSCDNLPVGFVNDLQPLYWDYLRHAMKWSRGKQDTFICYFYLIETTKPSENWEPNNLYCVIGKTRFAKAFTEFFKGMVAKLPNKVTDMLNPAVSSPIIQIDNTSGRDGQCVIIVDYPTVLSEPIEVKNFGYTSLDTAYIPPGFDENRYQNLVNKYVEEIYKNKDFILKAKFKAEEEERKKACEKANKKFVPKKMPAELVVKVNGHEYPNPLEDFSQSSELEDDIKNTSTPVQEETEKPAKEPTAPVDENAANTLSAFDKLNEADEDDPFAGFQK